MFYSHFLGQNVASSGSENATRNLSYYMKPDTMKNVQRIKELAHNKYENRLKNVKSFDT